MRVTAAALTALFLAVPSISVLKYQRTIPAAAIAGQRYIVVDDGIWEHARADLGDLRLALPDREVPYTLQVERESAAIEQREVRVLQPAIMGGKTQFLLDMSGVPEYDRVALSLNTKNFVAHARVSGQDDPHGSRWALLGTTTLYDLSDENLGHNTALQIPRSTYKFLQVTVDGSVKPADVLGGTAGITRSEKAVWRTIGAAPSIGQKDKDTILTFSVPRNVPVDRIVFDVDPAQPNFRRDVSVQTSAGAEIRSGEITRVHMQREGQKIDVDGTFAYIGTAGQTTLKVVVHNGDDAPLKISAARLEQYERRIYFEAVPGAAPRLYYGDAQLSAPVYDYAKFFQKDANATVIAPGAEATNAEFTGRPDERPWSERHPLVLWGAIVVAVVILGAIAIRSMRSAAA